MVGQARVSIAYQHERTFDMGSLRRLAIWGGSAAVALLVAVLAGYSDASSRRLMAADAQTTSTPPPSSHPVCPRSTHRRNVWPVSWTASPPAENC